MGVQHLSAITFAVRDMARAIEFYEKCGFAVAYGGKKADFTSLQSDQAFVNLIATSSYEPKWWGRVIFRVSNADAQYRLMSGAGLKPDAPPQDASWGERYFHITDLDGHELSFAQLLAAPESTNSAP